MSFMDELGGIIEWISNDVQDKATELKETYTLKKEYRETEKFLTKRYIELGKNSYKRNKKKHQDITDAIKRLDALEAELYEIRGTVECNACGAINPKEASFCNNCGSSLDVTEEETEDTAEKVDAEVVDENATEDNAAKDTQDSK